MDKINEAKSDLGSAKLTFESLSLNFVIFSPDEPSIIAILFLPHFLLFLQTSSKSNNPLSSNSLPII